MSHPTTPAICDSDKLLRTLYRLNHHQLYALHDLESAAARPSVAGFPGVISGVCAAVNTGFTAPDRQSAVVVGGGCLGYSGADPGQLRVDYLTDTMIALAFAAWAQLDCLIYLPIGEEMITARPEAHEGWQAFGDTIEALARRLAATVASAETVTILRTDAADIRHRLDKAVASHTGDLDATAIGDLYSLRPSGKQVTPSESRLDQYRATIATYLPDVVADLLGRSEVRHIVVAENMHQVKAVAAARALADAAGLGRVDHLAHVPAPSIGGTTRMAVARPDSAVIVTDTTSSNIAKMRRSNALVRGYWQATWDLHRAVSSLKLTPALVDMIGIYRQLAILEDRP
jgi:hypothetical protein